MSRRCHHGSPRHVRNGRVPPRPLAPERTTRLERGPLIDHSTIDRPTIDRPTAAEPAVRPTRPLIDVRPGPVEPEPGTGSDGEAIPARIEAAPVGPGSRMPPPRERGSDGARARAASLLTPALAAPAATQPDGDEAGLERGATAPQLRRFIKSRAYVPMHELRRRFAINGGDDDVTVVDLDRQRVYVGLPEREGRLLGELLRGGDIGYELSLDPISPIVVGVYPMRPVTRA